MAANEVVENLEQVKEVATLAGLKGAVDEEKKHFQMLFALPGDRRQMVLVRDSSAKGRKVVVETDLSIEGTVTVKGSAVLLEMPDGLIPPAT